VPVSAAPEDEDGGTLFADPLPYLRHFNAELEEQGHEPLFEVCPSFATSMPDEEGYDLTRTFDFRGWPLAPGTFPHEFLDGWYDVPASRIRVVGEHEGKLLHACYERVPLPIAGTTAEIAKRAMEPLPFKWRITYRIHSWEHCDCANAKLTMISGPGYADLYHEDCGRWRKTKVDGPLDEHVESLNLAPPDEMYDGYYPTLPGSDVAHINQGAPGMDEHRGGRTLYGQPELDNQNRVIDGRHEIRGGTEIRGGRAEWKRKTKGMILWDTGTQADFDKENARKAEERKARNRDRVARKLAEAPPSLEWT
jgi:hypothetical protein